MRGGSPARPIRSLPRGHDVTTPDDILGVPAGAPAAEIDAAYARGQADLLRREWTAATEAELADLARDHAALDAAYAARSASSGAGASWAPPGGSATVAPVLAHAPRATVMAPPAYGPPVGATRMAPTLPPWEPAPVPTWDTSPPRAPAAPSSPRRGPVVAIAVALALVLVGVVISAAFMAGRIDPHGQRRAADLQVGECFQDPYGIDVDAEILVQTVAAQPCTSPHDNEVYEVAAYAEPRGAPFPGTDEMIDRTARRCMPGFASFIGTTHDDSDLGITFLYPSSDTWPLGDRTIVCAVYDPAGPVTGTLRGAGR
jgi:putative regulator of septum formation